MAKTSKSISKTFVWIIVGLLCFAMIGFGASGLGGTVRTIGSVGDRQIGVQEYVRAIQSEMRAFQAQSGTTLTFQQAQSFGIDRRALQQLVTTAALEHEASELGLSIGDENLRTQLLAMSAFQGVDGQFDREAYRFALQNAGLNENQFEDDLRAESARTLLQGAVLSATPMPATYAETMVGFIGEARGFTWARLSADALTADVAEPDDAALQAFYDDNIADFTLPETRKISYAWLTPDMLLDTIETPDDQLRALYDERDAEFNRPERRLVERLAFLDQAAADAARAQLDAGDATFDSLVEARGLTLDDIDLGDVARDELEADAQEAVFTAEVGDVVGPAPSDFGPALFRVNAVLAEQITTFEQARPDLVEQYQRDRAERLIQGQIQDIEDLLASGASMEELGSETDMETGTIDWSAGVDDGIAGYDAFARVAAASNPGDFAELAELSDGGIFTLQVDEILEPRPEAFDDVRDRVTAAWTQAEITKLLSEQAQEYANQLREGRTFASLTLLPNTETDQIRRSFIDGTPRELLSTAFDMASGDVEVFDAGTDVYIVRLDSVAAPDLASEDSTALLQTVNDQTSGGIAQDLFQALANDVQSRAGLNLDQQALNAVHAQFGGGAGYGGN